MTVYNRQTEGKLNDILTILGATKTTFFPFWEKTGQLVTGIGNTNLIPAETGGAAEDLEHDFAPHELTPGSGLHVYQFSPTGDHHLAGTDNAAFSFVAAAFSVGAWIRPRSIVSNAILAKYDSAGNAEEWRFWIDAAGLLDLELHDASASTTEIGVSSAAIVLNQMQFVVATYDGTPATPDVHLYVDGVDLNPTGATTEAGAFVDMEDTATPLTVGCGGVTATPTTEFDGCMAMPFICGKQLTAAEVVALRDIMRPLVGIS
ncbi:MAG: hypothetical protein A2Y74_06015 [Actinobacteria bacterium RBG_13_63_9]|nr:MAG: hypothetical protein A2Y74_06015 [Actinobacteria bacterium RBG_13_63_9]